jgi:hypothetical protein
MRSLQRFGHARRTVCKEPVKMSGVPQDTFHVKAATRVRNAIPLHLPCWAHKASLGPHPAFLAPTNRKSRAFPCFPVSRTAPA